MRNDLWTKGLVVGIIMLFVGTSVLPSMGINTDLKKKEIVTEKTEKSDGWYYYPSLPNYAPSGLPDFNQDQDRNWVLWGRGCCGEVCECDIYWYLDSKYSNPDGIPGDGIDEFPLVQDYHARGTPNPGPYSDDHNFNNVNDPSSPFNVNMPVDNFEFIEQYLWNEYYNAGDKINEYWIAKAGLSSQFQSYRVFYEVPMSNFNLSQMVHDMADKMMSGDYYYVLQMDLLDRNGNYDGCHCVAIAGINVDKMQIAVSDPAEDQQNYTNNLYLHNDAKYVSHDIFTLTSDVPKWNWGIDYRSPTHHSNTVYGVVAWTRIIKINHPPAKPSPPTGETKGQVGTYYSFSTNTTDPDGNVLYYNFSWGDGKYSGWLGWYRSGETIQYSYSWSEEGNYDVKVQARDDYGLLSDWSDPLPIKMPYSYNKPVPQFFERLFQRFPTAFPILQHMMGY